jgi:hypothetical protein
MIIITVLKSVAMIRLVKPQQAGKGLAGAVEISKGTAIACNSQLSQ